MGEIHVRGKARLFKNPVLEALTRTNEYITFFTYVPLITFVFIVGLVRFNLPIENVLPLFFVAVLSWTLVEYLMHRFLFHWINDSKAVQRFHFFVHGVHHSYPKDKGRLFLPPIPGLTIASIFFLIFYLTMGNYAFAFFPGFVVGYLGYVFTHFAIHKFRKPKNFIGYVWDHHNLHHFKHDDKAFGVSSPLWDYVFGTMPPKRSTKQEA